MSQTSSLTDQEQQTLACVAAVMIPANETHTVPSAGDPVIVADMVRTLGRDLANVRQALAGLDAMAGGSFATLGESRQELRLSLVEVDAVVAAHSLAAREVAGDQGPLERANGDGSGSEVFAQVGFGFLKSRESPFSHVRNSIIPP